MMFAENIKLNFWNIISGFEFFSSSSMNHATCSCVKYQYLYYQALDT